MTVGFVLKYPKGYMTNVSVSDSLEMKTYNETFAFVSEYLTVRLSITVRRSPLLSAEPTAVSACSTTTRW